MSVPGRPQPPAGFGVYVHVPFCAQRCDYCAFATWTDRAHGAARYLRACRTDLERAVDAGLPPATSVFVGGGTPSLVGPDLLGAVLDAVPRAPGAEVTVECNPEDVDVRLVEAYAAHGVNRISLGVQSLVPHVLATLGRRHGPPQVETAVAAVHAGGIQNLNLDLIYGARGETGEDWGRTVRGALDLGPAHVSAYALTVEPGTALAADATRHPDDDDQAAKYLVADELLTAAGLASYEISNWARPGAECRHNLLYWRQGDYLGIGCAAHSHRAGRRWWNVRTPERYVELVEAGRPTEAGAEQLDAATARLEGLQLALRTADGVPADTLPVGPWDDGDAPLVVRDAGRVRLTVRGRLVANDLANRLE